MYAAIVDAIAEWDKHWLPSNLPPLLVPLPHTTRESLAAKQPFSCPVGLESQLGAYQENHGYQSDHYENLPSVHPVASFQFPFPLKPSNGQRIITRGVPEFSRKFPARPKNPSPEAAKAPPEETSEAARVLRLDRARWRQLAATCRKLRQLAANPPEKVEGAAPKDGPALCH
jgi:hypothetical protein